MRVGVLGINHKWAHLNLRELLAQACQRCFVTSGATHGQHTFILLSTCNRTEVYFTSEDLAETHSYLLNILRNEISNEFDQKVYSFFGQDCFLHLCRVTAGLDSAIIAETEIQGQVKAAYENASKCVKLPGELHYLFQKALKVGKQVRTEVVLGRGMPDLEHAVYQTGTHFFSAKADPKVLFVGASDINCKIASFLRSKSLNDITLCNRSGTRSIDIAEPNGLKVLPWEQLHHWPLYNWIIFGTKAPHHLIGRTDLNGNHLGHKLIMDLSVPRNVEPRIGREKGITLLNIDQINRILQGRRRCMTHSLIKAENLVSESAHQYVQLFQHKAHRYSLCL